MTLPRLIITGVWIGAGVSLASYCGNSWGAFGYAVGFAVGLGVAITLTWLFFLGRILVFFPFPICRNGKCRSIRDYVWKKGTVYGWEGGVYQYKCRCGERYVRKRRQFLEVLPDGTIRPYKKLTRFRRWTDDNHDY